MIPALTWEEALLRLALAAVFGGAIGLERELRDREAGLRTHMLVSVGAALFTIISAYGFRDFLIHNGGGIVRADPSRIAAQIVTGIGFLGAGAIIRQGFSVRGLTTAATLWVVAAIGLASGAGYYSAALIATLVVLGLLWPLRYLVRGIYDRPSTYRFNVQMAPGEGAGVVVEAFERLGAQIESFEAGDQEGAMEIKVVLPRSASPDLVIQSLLRRHEVRSAAWQT